jgi:hypothetical protein
LSQQQTPLTTKSLQKDARVHYTVLKIRAGTPAPCPPHTREPAPPGKQHTQQNEPTSSLVRAGPSHPPHQQHVSVAVTQKKQNQPPKPSGLKNRARFLRTQQRASMIHSAPSAFHTHKWVVLASAAPLHI